jgi:hypothetical protein
MTAPPALSENSESVDRNLQTMRGAQRVVSTPKTDNNKRPRKTGAAANQQAVPAVTTGSVCDQTRNKSGFAAPRELRMSTLTRLSILSSELMYEEFFKRLLP